MEVVEIPVAFIVLTGSLVVGVLLAPKDPHHWSYYLGPVQSVTQGGSLLWDTPSQYGFLNVYTAASLSRLFNFEASLSLGILIFILQVLGCVAGFYVFRFRLGFSTFISALFVAVIQLGIPGADDFFRGPVAFPSHSAFRFAPAFLGLLCFDGALHKRSRISGCSAVFAIAASCLWSAESALYTTAPIVCYLFLSVVRDCRLSSIVTRGFSILLIAFLCAAGGLALYGLMLSGKIDLNSFFEYALAYSSSVGTLTMKPDVWTGIFFVIPAVAYFFARHQFRGKEFTSIQGVIFVGYVFCTATYFVARSHYSNVQTILPWWMVGIAAIRLHGNAKLRAAQRAGVFIVCAISFGYLVSLNFGVNRGVLAKRQVFESMPVLPVFEPVPAEVGQAAHAAVGSDKFTVINDWALYRVSPELGGVDNTLPIGPLRHLLLLPEGRRREYAGRMLERVPSSFLLLRNKEFFLVTQAFGSMDDIVRLTEIPFQYSETWKLLEISRSN
jgi:hypothetical protein